MVGLIVLLMLPTGLGGQPTGVHMYGTTTIEQYDTHGNQIFSQTVHNLITDDGEDYLIAQVFREDSEEIDDKKQISTICITDSTTGFGESQDASNFNMNNGLDVSDFDTCIGNNASDQTHGEGLITLGPFTFAAGENLESGETIEGIGICPGDTNNGTSTGTVFQECGMPSSTAQPLGILFATIDTGDVTLNGGDTAEISYTFDIGESNVST